ncbi:hypothetical protein, partial [Ideonella sp. B508-1]|uniref:hypothetical protein n=1 Tax=Ideonella sp. B508-1 TaxID=137716 RepID=UPI001F322DF9
ERCPAAVSQLSGDPASRVENKGHAPCRAVCQLRCMTASLLQAAASVCIHCITLPTTGRG